MPLFIDLHIDQNLTPDVVKECHVADKAIQAKYGVRYLQILLNKPQGYLFCLAEAPDKESCAKVHQEAHGNIACNVLEITQSDFSSLLASKPKDGLDFTLNHDGTLDTGNRAVLALTFLGPPEYRPKMRELVKNELDVGEGQSFENLEPRVVALFDSCSSALNTGISIRNKILENSIPFEARMGISYGPPLEEKGNLFESVRRSADHFSFFSMNGQITISSKAMQLCGSRIEPQQSVKVVTPADEKFLNQVMDCTERVWDDNEMTMTHFAHELGISKSQLARKLHLLSNLSPNDFLKEFRMRRSISLMEDKSLNVAEITMAIGFTNPSYFTKCFHKRFGTAPSSYMAKT